MFDQVGDVSALLDMLAEELGEFRTAEEQRTRSEAPNFSAFTYIDPDENLLSWILADLLAPWGTHGQGHIFLREFLGLSGLSELKAESCYRIKREEQTDTLKTERRIDILLEGQDWVVGIENKPWAADQARQVQDYLNDLAGRRKARSVLVYLTKTGRPPSESSIETEAMFRERADGRLVLLSFEQVLHWLKACEQICLAPRVNAFLDDFQRYIERRLLGQASKRESTMIVDIVTSNGDRLDAALELMRSRDAIRLSLLQKAMEDISGLIKDGWIICRRLDDGNAGIGLKPPNAGHWHICFEPQRGSYEQWIYGIKRNGLRGDNDEARLIGERLPSAMPVGARSSKWWPYYRPFNGFDVDGLDPRQYRNWEASTGAWKDMHNGKFAQNIVGLAEKLHNAVLLTSV